MSEVQSKEEREKQRINPFNWFLNRPEFLPLILATFPALALASNNVREIAISNALRPVVLSLLGSSLIYIFFRVLRRGSGQSALATAWVVLLFFSYGHSYALLKGVQLLGEPLGRHRYLAPLSVILTLVVLWLVFHRIRRLSSVLPTLNIVALALVVVPSVQLTIYALQAKSRDNASSARPSDSVILSAPSDITLPDIYYIILDSYGRSDVLKKTYGYDNSEFLNELESMGFYVANESTSNYSYTILSVASSLNYSYLQDLGLGLDSSQSASDWFALAPLIKNSQIRRDLSSIGYSMIAFETGFRPTTVDNADIYLSPDLQGPFATMSAITPLETMMIQTTALKIITDGRTIATELMTPHARHREMILFQLESLKQIPELNQPKFVFAHIMAPHKPYVFGPDGEARTPTEAFTLGNHDAADSDGTDRKGYVDQVIFIEDQIVDVIREILKESREPPIIILQGDHGLPLNDVSPSERMAILNAYFLPRPARDQLYPEISPVNSFRVVLGSVFGADLPLVEDEGYFSRYPDLFDTTRIDVP